MSFIVGMFIGFMFGVFVFGVIASIDRGPDDEVEIARDESQRAFEARLIAENNVLRQERDRALMECARLREVDADD